MTKLIELVFQHPIFTIIVLLVAGILITEWIEIWTKKRK